MPKHYSIAEARHSLAGMVREAEAGSAIEITRRGKPVAVLLSAREYDRLRRGKKKFSEADAEFRRTHDMSRTALDFGEVWRDVRDASPTPGREPPW